MQSNLLTLDDVSRLLQLVVAVADESQCTLSQAIERMTEHNAPRLTGQPDRTALAEFAGRWRQVRIKRNAIFGAPIFREPSYDMLLELFAADQRRQQLSITSLCYASGAPMTTALRHIDKLEAHGLIVREGDKHDNRRCYVRPTHKAITGLEMIYMQWHAAWLRVMDLATRHPSTSLRSAPEGAEA